ncbi:hypothetical protein [Actinocorallia libanotica]|uniref:Uncharacterized protein n=1 Tax=Actinocorallia libanotica TaxID=46162 RepID=A0ABN1RXQ9_9ACTN
MTETKSTTRKQNPTYTRLRNRHRDFQGLLGTDLPLIGGRSTKAWRDYYAERAEAMTERGAGRLAENQDGYDAHLLALLYLALSSDEPEGARHVLVDVAAVALLAAESLGGDR